MQQKYRMYRRRNRRFYWQDKHSVKQGSLQTSDRRAAEKLLNAMNEAQRQPILNLSLARAYLVAHDPKMITRTWSEVMDEMATHGIPSTQERCSRAFEARLTIQFATNRCCNQRASICSLSCTQMETVLSIICDDFTISRSISVGCPSPSSQNEHGPKSAAKVRERSRPKNTLPSSLPRKIPNVGSLKLRFAWKDEGCFGKIHFTGQRTKS